MIKEELLKNYCVDSLFFNQCIKEHLIQEKDSYTQDDIKNLSQLIDLKKVGFETKDILYYQELLKEEKKAEIVKMFKNQRNKVLKKVHEEENKLSILDYYIYKMR